MSSRGDTSGGSGDRTSASNVPPSRRKYDVSGTLSDPREKDDTEAKKSLFREQGATDIQNAMDTPFMPMVGRVLSGPLKAGSRINRDYFTNTVLGTGGYKNVINEYTHLDPTLPRVKFNMDCPNPECDSNKKADSESKDPNDNQTKKCKEIIYLRYDDKNMKFIYLCAHCDTTWLSSDNK